MINHRTSSQQSRFLLFSNKKTQESYEIVDIITADERQDMIWEHLVALEIL